MIYLNVYVIISSSPYFNPFIISNTILTNNYITNYHKVKLKLLKQYLTIIIIMDFNLKFINY